MSESECRHLPRPVWNPARCAKCGATLEEPANARLIRAARRVDGEFLEHGDVGAATFAELHDAIAGAERGGPAWTSERPTVPGAWWLRQPGFPDEPVRFTRQEIDHWRGYMWAGILFAGPIPEPAEPAPDAFA